MPRNSRQKTTFIPKSWHPVKMHSGATHHLRSRLQYQNKPCARHLPFTMGSFQHVGKDCRFGVSDAAHDLMTNGLAFSWYYTTWHAPCMHPQSVLRLWTSPPRKFQHHPPQPCTSHATAVTSANCHQRDRHDISKRSRNDKAAE